MKSYKKLLAILLSMTLLFSTISCLTLVTSAEAVIEEMQVDLTKMEAVKTNPLNVTLSYDNITKGYARISTTANSFYFNNATSAANVWSKAILILRDENGDAVRVSAGYKYIINVEYNVVYSNGNNSLQLVLFHNDNNNVTSDNGARIIKAGEKHTANGSYSLSAEFTGVQNRPLRLSICGVGAAVIKSIKIQRVATSANVKKVNCVDGNKTFVSYATDTIPAPTYTGAEHAAFAGWFTDSAFTTPATDIVEGNTYYAKWASVTRNLDLVNGNRTVNYWDSSLSANVLWNNNDGVSYVGDPETGSLNVVSTATSSVNFAAGSYISGKNGNTLPGKHFLTLEYDDIENVDYDNSYDSYVKLEADKQYAITIRYNVKSISSGSAKIAIFAAGTNLGNSDKGRVLLGNNNITSTGEGVIYGRTNGGSGLIDYTYGGEYGDSTDTKAFPKPDYIKNYKLRLAVAGNATIEIYSITVQEVYAADTDRPDDSVTGSVVSLKMNNNDNVTADGNLSYVVAAAKDYTGNWSIPSPMVYKQNVEGVFGGFYTDSALTSPITSSTVFTKVKNTEQNIYAKWNYAKGDVDLKHSDVKGIFPSWASSNTFKISKTENNTYLADFQKYDTYLFNADSFVPKATAVLGGSSLSLEYYNGGLAKVAQGHKYIVTVKYNVVEANSNVQYHPQIAIVTNPAGTVDTDEYGSSNVFSAMKHAKTGNGFVLSAVIDTNDENVNEYIRLAFSGVGKIEIVGLTVSQLHNTETGYAKAIYNYNDVTEADFVKLGTITPELANTNELNFAGWFSGSNKVISINSDVNLTATYTSKFDSNFDFNINICDLVFLKSAIVALTTNSAYDINRDGVIDNLDTEASRNNLLYDMNNTTYIAGSEISTFSVVKASEGSLLTDLAADTLANDINDSFKTKIEVKSVAPKNKIVIGITNLDNNSAINSLVGVRGDIYGINDYKVFAFEGNVYIEGGSDFAVAAGANAFSKYLSAYKSFASGIVISGYTDNATEILDGYKLRYSDEFNGETINTSGKWWFTALQTALIMTLRINITKILELRSLLLTSLADLGRM